MTCQDILLIFILSLTSTINTLVGQAALLKPTQRPEMSTEKRLIDDLMGHYSQTGRHGRPVYDMKVATPVKFGMGLIQMELDEKKKILQLSAWTRYVWRDEYLTWNKSDYANITQIRLDPDLLWIPDIMLYNTPMDAGTLKDADVDIANRHAMAVISYKGKVSWYPHTIFKASCSIDVTHFPFDHQECSTWFGSWTYNSREMDLKMVFPGGIDLSSFRNDYKDSCAWDIYNVTSTRKFLPDEESDPAFIVLAFDLQMRRKMVFSSYILTLPCIFLACLTLVVFCLPPERPDRTSLSMSIFSSFLVLLLILCESAPPSAGSIPKLGVYYCFNMVIIMGSVILSSFVVSVSRGFSGQPGISKAIEFIIGTVLGTVLIMRKKAPPVPIDPRGNKPAYEPASEHETMRMINGRVYGVETTRNRPAKYYIFNKNAMTPIKMNILQCFKCQKNQCKYSFQWGYGMELCKRYAVGFFIRHNIFHFVKSAIQL